MVECAGFENRSARKGSGSSNLPLSVPVPIRSAGSLVRRSLTGANCATILLLGVLLGEFIPAASICADDGASSAIKETEIANSSRADLLAQANLPKLVELPIPAATAIALPDDWHRQSAAVSIRLSRQPAGGLSVRRVGRNDGRLYLEIYAGAAPMSGEAQISLADRQLGRLALDGSVWLSLKPRIGKLAIRVIAPDSKEPIELIAPTTLVEVRGRQIFVNGEPFLIKGATGQIPDPQVADYIHGLGLNTLRGLGAIDDCQRYGFMSIASLNLGDAATKEIMRADDAEFEQCIAPVLAWLKDKTGVGGVDAGKDDVALRPGGTGAGGPVGARAQRDPWGDVPLDRFAPGGIEAQDQGVLLHPLLIVLEEASERGNREG